MATDIWKNPGRWRAFADAMALALGVNVWISVVVLPGTFVGAWHVRSFVVSATLAFAVLAIGVVRRAETLLLLAFPSALLLPVAAAPAIASPQVYGLTRFVVVAGGLVAYLFGVSFFTSFREPTQPESERPLASSRQPLPPRWKRRLRMYRMLVILSIVFPAVLLYAANFHAGNQAFIIRNFPGRAAQMTALLNAIVIGAWILLFARYFLGTLKYHRTGDRQLRVDLATIQTASHSGKPGPMFYAGVTAALGFMSLLVVSRYW